MRRGNSRKKALQASQELNTHLLNVNLSPEKSVNHKALPAPLPTNLPDGLNISTPSFAPPSTDDTATKTKRQSSFTEEEDILLCTYHLSQTESWRGTDQKGQPGVQEMIVDESTFWGNIYNNFNANSKTQRTRMNSFYSSLSLKDTLIFVYHI